MNSYRLDPDLGYIPDIPVPFWVRHWLFWSRPSCYPCRMKFRRLADYNMHYLNVHLVEGAKAETDKAEKEEL